MTTSIWNELRLNNQLCDGIIKTSDGNTYPIHRVILSAFSRYFLALFTNTLNNGNPDISELALEDVPSDIVRLIIEFAYTQHCKITMDNAYLLFVTADRFGCESLVSYCSDFISRHINTSNCISTFKFARNYFCRDLEVSSISYSKNKYSCSTMQE